jgi:hypothetical protein
MPGWQGRTAGDVLTKVRQCKPTVLVEKAKPFSAGLKEKAKPFSLDTLERHASAASSGTGHETR